jgi:hypothetical protein
MGRVLKRAIALPPAIHSGDTHPRSGWCTPAILLILPSSRRLICTSFSGNSPTDSLQVKVCRASVASASCRLAWSTASWACTAPWSSEVSLTVEIVTAHITCRDGAPSLRRRSRQLQRARRVFPLLLCPLLAVGPPKKPRASMLVCAARVLAVPCARRPSRTLRCLAGLQHQGHHLRAALLLACHGARAPLAHQLEGAGRPPPHAPFAVP